MLGLLHQLQLNLENDMYNFKTVASFFFTVPVEIVNFSIVSEYM